MMLRSGRRAGEGDSPEIKKDIANGQMDASSTVNIVGRKVNYVILLAHFNIFLYALCFWIQNGTLPYLTKKLGVDPVTFGYLQTTFALVQLCGGPMFGRFGDLYGGRAALTLAFTSAALSYGLLGMAGTIPMLFISRLPSVFMHAMQGGQMVVTDMSDSSGRADALGKLGLSYGIGMVGGSLVGGVVTKHLGEQLAAYVACFGSLTSVVLCMTLIPATTKSMVSTSKEETEDKSGVFSLTKYIELMKQPGAMPLLLIRLVSGIPIGVFQSMFALVAMDRFGLGPQENGFIMAYIGVLSMITQGVGIGMLNKRMSEMSILKLGAFVLIWAYLLLAFVGNLTQLYLVLVPLCVGLTLTTVVIVSALTKTVSDADTGAMLGMSMAVNSMIRSMSPMIGGFMLQSLGFSSFGYLGCINSSLVTYFLFVHMSDKHDR